MFRGRKKNSRKKASTAPVSTKTVSQSTNKPRRNSAETATSTIEPSLNVKSEKEFDRKNILGFVQKSFGKMPQGLRAEFLSMKRTNDFTIMKAFLSANESNRNRYKDVGCLDNCRVVLNPPWPHDYIHANYVATPANPRKFICTQAPLEKTCADFWYMCLSDHVEVILMLCNFIEKGANKCFKYYPEKGDTLTFAEGPNKVTVYCKASKELSWGEVKLKESVLYIEGMGNKLRTRHLHWIDWPDRCVPPPDLTIIKLLTRYRTTKNPIVVHCSAGIGRTGCVVMIEYMLEQIELNQRVSEGEEILKKIRTQRNNSVQTEHQYIFVHQVILNYLQKKSYIDKTVDPYMKLFAEEYKKVVI